MHSRRPGSGWRRILLITGCGVLLAASVGARTLAPRLHRTRYRLEPSELQLQTLPPFEPRWQLSPDVAATLPALLTERGFAPALIAALTGRRSIDPGTGEGWIVPDATLRDQFTPEQRQAWRLLLTLHPGNVAERWPLSLSAATCERLRAQPAWQDAVARLERWGWNSGSRLIFSDLDALEDTFASAADRRAFYQVALGGETTFLKLVPDPDIGATAAYWQVHGRYRAIEPFLNAVAAIDDPPRLDVAHLLPRLARSLLNSFPPHLGNAEDPGIESSFLASDFFALTPGVERQEPGGFAGWLERHCVPATAPLQYGDIVVYGDQARTPWPYAAVHLADGVVFARRPTAFGAWQFLEMAEIPELNPRLAVREPRAFRLRQATTRPGEPPFIPGRMPGAWRQRLALEPLPVGPWGRLWVYDVLLAPSTDLLQRLPEPERDPVWVFAGLDPASARRQLEEIPMPANVRRDLHAAFAAATRNEAGQWVVRPAIDLVWATPPEVRQRLFPFLVGGTGITDYVQHIPFPAGFSIDAWFESGALPESVRQGILRLVYPVDGGTRLSDYGALYHAFPSPRERVSAQRAALRFPALVVLLEKPRPEDVPGLVRYWRNQQSKSVRTLLTSFAAAGDEARFLDIVHLLPPIGREFLNTYFLPTGPSLTPSCYWTAFNFDQDRPDDRYLVVPGLPDLQGESAWRELMTRFDLIEAPSQLGDIIAYRRSGASAVDHVCTYVADGLVFTKNGSAFSAPWHLARTSEIDAAYLTGPEVERVCFRRR